MYDLEAIRGEEITWSKWKQAELQSEAELKGYNLEYRHDDLLKMEEYLGTIIPRLLLKKQK